MKKRWMKRIPFAIAIVSLGIFVFSSAVMLLWNAILPAVLHVGIITFWQAAGILLLCKLLFGGFRRPYGAGGWHKKRMLMKWDSMSDEEKEEFRGRMQRCGRRHSAEAAG